jgi:8-oxo-dGTP pyrophosphatase MutT (NUDIX family)/CTP:molybdopterin cytidylyltransferase MocA
MTIGAMTIGPMTIGAVVMAGGAGARMQRGGVAVPKPLVHVRGASLLERNLDALLGAGLREIWVACGEPQTAIRAEIERYAAAARRAGVAVHALLEPTPLGTIGAVGLVGDRVETVLTVNADNLTALDLRALVAAHLERGAQLTLASHLHASRLPYGALDVDGDRVTRYLEKPAHEVRICSAVCVLGPAARALAAARAGAPLGLHELTERLIARGGDVRAFHHDAPWIDVNEPADVARADALVAAAPERLERWAARPDLEVVGAVVRDGERLLLERRADRAWDTPGGKLEPGEPPARALARELAEELGVDVAAGPELACFDALEADGRIIRHHVFAPAVRRADVRACEGQALEWFDAAALPAACARVVARSLACAGRPA